MHTVLVSFGAFYAVVWKVFMSVMHSYYETLEHGWECWLVVNLKDKKKNSIDYSEVMMPRVLAPSSLWVENVITLSANFSRTTNGNWMQLSSAC